MRANVELRALKQYNLISDALAFEIDRLEPVFGKKGLHLLEVVQPISAGSPSDGELASIGRDRCPPILPPPP